MSPLRQRDYAVRPMQRREDEYEVLVSEDRIVEVREIRGVSAGLKGVDDFGDGVREQRAARHSWMQSAKHYETPLGNATLAIEIFEDDCMWLIGRGLAAFQRLRATLLGVFG